MDALSLQRFVELIEQGSRTVILVIPDGVLNFLGCVRQGISPQVGGKTLESMRLSFRCIKIPRNKVRTNIFCRQ